MTISWPVGVPTSALIDGYEETPMSSLAEFQPETGMPMLSRRTSEEVEKVRFSTIMTYTQYDTLRTFRKDTLKSGALPFQRTHPRRTGSTVTALFTAIGSPININGVNCEVPMEMMMVID